ncbi:hypothetical protein [Coxiella endosymbiont of Amblyomma nuttalli]|uniref:hypothetical protein n=1 Tax=Coxiella endosymbiont of Amblyomma nuttalli TaxID=2749996 RepID=UPI001FD49382|nr:hypothetical protein [Coxiella endosymbiont of Amblyomma nuttalli]
MNSQSQIKEKITTMEKLKINTDWEVAVETVLSNYFDAICVNDVTSFLHSLADLSKGQITLVEKSVPSKTNSFNKAPTLISQVSSDWSLQHWLAGIYIVETIEEAKQLQTSLQENESIITKDGIWLGAHWVRVSKICDVQNSFLLRKQQVQHFKNKIIEQRENCDKFEMLLKAGELQVEKQETDRDITYRFSQEISAEITRVQITLSEKRTRLVGMQQRQNCLRESIMAWKERIERDECALAIVKSKAQSLSSSIGSLEKRREDILRQHDYYHRQLIERRENAHQKRKEADKLEIRLMGSKNQLNLLKRNVIHNQQRAKQLIERREILSQYLCEGDRLLNALNQKLQHTLEKQLAIEVELRGVEKKLEESNHILCELEQKRLLIQNSLHEVQTQLEEFRMQRQLFNVQQITIQEQLNENNFDYEQVIAALPANAAIDVWKEKSNRLIQRIQRMGPINLVAIEEYERVNERKSYLDRQHTDLTEALTMLKNAIQKIDRETRTKFQETYDKVNYHLQALFPQIFGGGKATLEMTKADLLTTDIIVRAQLPGKRGVTIRMLSGGEKTLTGIALIFSLFCLNPAPFCILDEVDVSLDDANVGRFCQLVREMSKEVQFLVISYNKATIEMADYLMGITMQEPGVSCVVSVNVQEAIEMVGTA